MKGVDATVVFLSLLIRFNFCSMFHVTPSPGKVGDKGHEHLFEICEKFTLTEIFL